MDRPILSIILPSVRPNLLRSCLDSIHAAAGRASYEIIVVADFGPQQQSNTTWVVTPRRGVIDAICIGSEFARGEYLFTLNDECILERNALEKMCRYAEEMPGMLLTPKHLPEFRFEYYGLPFAPFPFAHRALLMRLGGYLDPAYRAFYADPDLSMRAHQNGVPVEIVEDAVIHHHQNHDDAHRDNVNRYLAADRSLFQSRWDHLGRFVDPV